MSCASGCGFEWGSRATRALLGVWAGCLLAAGAGSASAATDDGLDWLETRVEFDGSFGQIPLRDTEAAAAALASFSRAPEVLDGAGLWYTYARSDVTEFSARRVRALAAYGYPYADELAGLKARLGSDGGWGTFAGWPSSLADTHQTLLTLALLGDPDLDTAGTGLFFLVSAQQSAGGFAWEDNTTADPILTAEILQTLVLWSSIFDLDAPIDAAASYLFSLQDGAGFIASALPNLSTALTLRATSTLDGNDSAWSAAYAALAGAQASSGAWSNDVYITSQALLALGSGRPDLAITAITPLADPLVEDDLVNVEITVQNQGRVGLSQAVPVPVDYISGSTGAVTRLATRSLSSLAGGATTTLTVTWDTTDLAGAGFLRAVADPDDLLGESDRADNSLLKAVTVLGGADLAVYAADASVQPGSPAPEDEIEFATTVYNFGALPLNGVSVALHDGAPGAGGVLLDTFSVSLASGGSQEISWTGSLASGAHDLTVTVDPAGLVEETSETNNRAVTRVTVAPRIDLQVASGQVRAAPDTVGEGQDVTLSVTVYNGGRSPAGAFAVGAYLYDPSSMGSPAERTLAAQASVTALAAGASATVALTVPSTGHLGNITLYGVADIGGAVAETQEGNNESSDTVYVLEAPNLSILGGDFNPVASATQGAVVPLTSVVRNNGGGTIYNVPVGFYLDSTSGTRIGAAVVQQLAAGQTATTPAVNWYTASATPGAHSLIAKVDPDGLLTESNESDNQQSASFTLNPKPDLAFTATGLVASPSAPEQGQLVTLTANLRNLTSSAVSASFEVTFYDGSPNAGGSLIGTATVPGIAANGTAAPSISWDTEGEAGRHTLYALIDPAFVVAEGDESNNQGTLSVVVTSGEADLEPPTNLLSSIAGDNVSLSWTPSGNPAGYRVYRDGLIVNAPDLLQDLVPGSQLVASSEAAGQGVGLAADGSTSTWWEGADDVDKWTLDAIFDEVQEVCAFRVVLKAQGNLAMSMALQTWDGRYWYTQESSNLSSTGTGTINGVFRLKRTVLTDRVRVLLQRSDSANDPASVAELTVNPPGLVTASSFVDINVDAASHLYEVRSANGGGREGEPAEREVSVGDVLPPTDTRAITYSNRTEVYWTASTSATADGYEIVRDNQPLLYSSALSGFTAVASSSDASYPASAGVDGNLGTAWISATGTSWTYDVTLPSTQRILGLTLYMVSGYQATSYDIMGWTGSQWIVEEEVRDNVFSSRGHQFSQFGATNKIRIRVNQGARSQVGIVEVAVTEAIPVQATGVTDGYRPDYAITYRVGAMSDAHVAFAETEPFAPPAGEEPPGPPSSLSVSSWTREDISLSWPAVSDANLAGYNIYDQETGELLNTGLITGTAFTVVGAIDPADTSYSYAVSSVNTFGYESPYVTQKTWTPPLPAAPVLTASAVGTTVSVAWTVADEVLRDGFYLYKDGSSHVDTPATAYDDLDVSAGSHSYKVAGYDMFGRTGSFSGSKSVTVVRTDLELSADGLSFAPEPATVLDSGVLTASVFNAGDQASAATTLAFYDGDPAAGGALIGSTSVSSIAGYGLKTVSVTWPLAAAQGDHTVFAVVDPNGTVPELDETNNKANLPVTVFGEPGFEPSLGTIGVGAFPVLSAPLTVIDTYGQPVTGLAARYITVVEDSAAVGGVTLVAGSEPGSYTVGWTSPTRSRNGSVRAVGLTVTVDELTGVTSGSYRAPSDPINDLTATSLVADPSGPEEDDDFSFVATVTNSGSETVASAVVRIYSGSVGGAVVGQGSTGSIASGLTGTARVATSAVAGTTTYYAVVDPDNTVAEANEADNTTSVALFVPENPLPDLVVDANRFVFTPTSPTGGDQVGLTAVIENKGAQATNVQVQAYLGEPSAGGKTIGGSQTIALLPRRGEVTLTFPWDTTGLVGSQTLIVWADPVNRIEERDETNNRGTAAVTVSAPRVSMLLSTGASHYAAQTSVDISTRVDPGGASFSGTLELTVRSAAGVVVEALAPVTVGPITGQTTYNRTWSTGVNRAGDYQVLAVLKEGAAERSRLTTPFVIDESRAMASAVSSGNTTYDAFATVNISGSVTNTSLNVALAQAQGTLEVVAPGGAVAMSETFGPQDLDLGQSLPVQSAFAVADAAPGTYTLRLQGSAAQTTSQATSTFEVRSTAVTGVGLVGTLLLDKDQAVPGEVIGGSWSLENRGNAGITGANGRIQVVGDDGAVCSAAAFAVTASKGATVGGSEPVETTCAEGTWSALLQIELGGSWRTLDRTVLNLLPVRGEIEVDPSEVVGGADAVTITYRAANQSDLRVDDLSFEVELVAVDSGQIVRTWPWSVSLDATQTQEVSQTLAAGELSLGEYHATLYFTPADGERSPLAEASFSVVDRFAPVSVLRWDGPVVLDQGIVYVPGGTRAVLQAVDDFSGVASLRYRYDGGEFVTYTAPFTPTVRGGHVLGYTSRDLAGNDEVEKSVDIVFDNAAPAVVVEGVENGTCTDADVTIALLVTDDSPTAVVMTLDGATYAGGAVTASGRHTFSATVTDLLGYQTAVSRTFNIVDDECQCDSASGCETPVSDGDADGYSPAEGDCDDIDPDRHPGADEACNGLDDDCDTAVDEGLSCETPTAANDGDFDGWADGQDCAPDDASINPGATELCGDGVDEDCDGGVDEGCEPTATTTPTVTVTQTEFTATEATATEGTQTETTDTQTPSEPPSEPPTEIPTDAPTAPPTTAPEWPTEPQWTPGPTATVPQTTAIPIPGEEGCACSASSSGGPSGLALLLMVLLGRLGARRRDD